MKIALTGAGGFLGQTILTELTAHPEITTVALTSQKETLAARYAAWPHITVKDNSAIPHIPFEEIDVLINAAFPMRDDGTGMAPGLAFIRELLEAAVLHGVGAVINISSQSVYSQKRESPAKEDTPLTLVGDYAVGKYAAELLTDTICRHTPHTNLRLASLIGEKLDRRVVNKFVRQVLLGEPLHLVGGGQRFGFLDVKDAARGIVTMLSAPPSGWAAVYNLGPKESVTLTEIAACVRAVGAGMGIPVPDMVLEETPVLHNSALDCQRFYTDFAFTPQYTLADSVKTIFAAEREKICTV